MPRKCSPIQRRLDTHAMRVEVDYEGTLSVRFNVPSRWLLVAGLVMNSMAPATPEAGQEPHDQARQQPVELSAEPQRSSKILGSESRPLQDRHAPRKHSPQVQRSRLDERGRVPPAPMKAPTQSNPARSSSEAMCRELDFEHLDCSQCAGPCILTCSAQRCGTSR
jgi:hypothetical protein